MADSYTDFGVADDLTSDQIAGTFDNLVLDYVSTADFYVTVTNGETKTTVAASDITVTTDPALKVVISNPSTTYGIVASSLVRIGRTTGVASQERVFSDGSVLKASDLNTAFKQVLFGIQEQIDGGLGSIPTDTDGKLDAGGKVIKNVGAATNANDAATKDYVDNLVLVGGGNPQNWSFNLNDGGWTTSGNDLTRTLTDPVPTSANDNLYLVEVGGVLQDPDNAYSVTESSGTYTLKLIDAQSELDNNVTVNLRNWGVTRNELLIPFKQETDSADSHALKVKNRSSDAAGDLVRFLDHDDTTIGKITEAGKLEIPEVSSKEGDLKVTSSVAVRNYDDNNDILKVDKGSVAGGTGTVTVTGDASFAGTTTFSGVLNAVGGLQLSGQSFKGLKAIVDRTGLDDVSESVIGRWTFAGRQLKLVKETSNYAEGDHLVMVYEIPVENIAGYGTIMNMVLNTASASVNAADSWTTTASEEVFGSANMVTKILGNKTEDGIGGVFAGGSQLGTQQIDYYRHSGIVVYQISAEDAAKDELVFDIILSKSGMTGNPKLHTAFGSIFTGFLVG